MCSQARPLKFSYCSIILLCCWYLFLCSSHWLFKFYRKIIIFLSQIKLFFSCKWNQDFFQMKQPEVCWFICKCPFELWLWPDQCIAEPPALCLHGPKVPVCVTDGSFGNRPGLAGAEGCPAGRERLEMGKAATDFCACLWQWEMKYSWMVEWNEQRGARITC